MYFIFEKSKFKIVRTNYTHYKSVYGIGTLVLNVFNKNKQKYN